MHHHQGIDWTAVGAVATFLAVVVALGTSVWDRRSAARAQARAVHAMYAQFDPAHHRAFVENGSAAPIFNISVVGVEPLQTSLGLIEWTGVSNESPLVKASPASSDSVDIEMRIPGQPLHFAVDPREMRALVITIEYTDAMSVRWRRRGTDRPKRVKV